MKSIPNIGARGELQFVVELRHAIDFAGDGMPAVLSTPNLIGWLERTARETLNGFLASDERSVGIEIELRHLAATPVGQSVTCIARVIQVDGRQIGFQIEARDAHELIARGVHRRAVVQIGAFASKVEQKV